MSVIVIAEKAWANSPLSIARYSGRVKYNGHEYVIVDKRGHDIFECSAEAEKEGRGKAIEPGEPADLCRTDLVPIYRKLGREEFLRFLKESPQIDSVKEAKNMLKTWRKN